MTDDLLASQEGLVSTEIVEWITVTADLLSQVNIRGLEL